MPVAKTYEKMKIDGEIFRERGHNYVNVVTPKGIKKVRWYSDAEYRRMYPGEGNKNGKSGTMDFNARHVFGFGDSGYINIYKGNESILQEFRELHQESFRYNVTFGIYTPSRLAVPSNLPAGTCAVILKWEEVMDHDDRMKPHAEVQKIVAAKLGTLSNSKYQGEKDEWLQKTVKVTEKKSKESKFGTKHTYTLKDSEGNLYVWETGAKDYESDKTVSLKMKVKEHKEIDGNEVTIVWYCKEV